MVANGDKGGRGVKKSHFCGDVIFERPCNDTCFEVSLCKDLSVFIGTSHPMPRILLGSFALLHQLHLRVCHFLVSYMGGEGGETKR